MSSRPRARALPRAAAVLSGLAVALVSTAAGAEGARVRFLAPRHLSTAIGPTVIELAVDVPRGVGIASLTVSIDGQPLVELRQPPWQAEWDAGDGSRGHGLRAVLTLTDGTSVQTVIRTSPLRIDQVEEVDLVNLYPLVRDRDGNYVTDLGKDDFQILEGDVPQTILRFTTERRPLRIGIVLDTSYSMKGSRLEDAQKAALGFLKVLDAGDEAMVVTFNDAVRITQRFTSDTGALGSAIMATEAHGGTALYDAIWRTSRQLEAFPGRRVAIVLSDGRDEATSGFEPGSLHTLEEALDRALRSEVMLFAIGLGRNLEEECARPWLLPAYRDRGCPPGESLYEILDTLAVSTGGRLLISPGPGKLRRAFELVAEDLRHQYSIAYRSTDERHDGAWRQIRVLTPGRDFEVVSRTGYFGPGPEPSAQAH